jgi:hypothetical protein
LDPTVGVVLLVEPEPPPIEVTVVNPEPEIDELPPFVGICDGYIACTPPLPTVTLYVVPAVTDTPEAVNNPPAPPPDPKPCRGVIPPPPPPATTRYSTVGVTDGAPEGANVNPPPLNVIPPVTVTVIIFLIEKYDDSFHHIS